MTSTDAFLVLAEAITDAALAHDQAILDAALDAARALPDAELVALAKRVTGRRVGSRSAYHAVEAWSRGLFELCCGGAG